LFGNSILSDGFHDPWNAKIRAFQKKKHKLNEKDGTHCDDEAPIEGKLNLILLLTRHA
jgi:hypothetical protein